MFDSRRFQFDIKVAHTHTHIYIYIYIYVCMCRDIHCIVLRFQTRTKGDLGSKPTFADLWSNVNLMSSKHNVWFKTIQCSDIKRAW